MNAIPQDFALVPDNETTIEPQPVTAITTPATLLALAIQQGAGLETLERLMDLQDRHDAKEARNAFVADMAAFKRNPPEILKTKLVAYEGVKYKHAELGDVCSAVVAALAEHGFSHRWDTKQDGGRIEVTCILTHRLGHSESTMLHGAPDGSGKKNAIQQIASTVTYLQRYTLLAATGLATNSMDDDGRGAGDDGYDCTAWFDAINGSVDMTELNRVAADIKNAKGIPKAPLANIKALWSAKATALKSGQPAQESAP